MGIAPNFQRLPTFETIHRLKELCGADRPGCGTITGTLALPSSVTPSTVLVGVFDSPIPQSAPVAFQVLTGPEFTRLAITGVPPGRWTVIAVAESTAATPAAETLLVGTLRSPVTVASGGISRASLQLRELRPTDPPIAVTLAPQLDLQRSRKNVTRPPYHERRPAA
ncbi:hypothetical protein [Salinactinospora qingdaonensis]|uniref:hypothetical protein n=1 Tax=Salinactinospora qingdaonensis TaxID=702744 RepID=UPI0031E5B1D1